MLPSPADLKACGTSSCTPGQGSGYTSCPSTADVVDTCLQVARPANSTFKRLPASCASTWRCVLHRRQAKLPHYCSHIHQARLLPLWRDATACCNRLLRCCQAHGCATLRDSRQCELSMQEHSLQPDGDVMVYQYHPPFAPNFLRRVEVLYKLQGYVQQSPDTH